MHKNCQIFCAIERTIFYGIVIFGQFNLYIIYEIRSKRPGKHFYLFNTIEQFFNQMKHYIKIDKPNAFTTLYESVKSSINKIKEENYEKKQIIGNIQKEH